MSPSSRKHRRTEHASRRQHEHAERASRRKVKPDAPRRRAGRALPVEDLLRREAGRAPPVEDWEMESSPPASSESPDDEHDGLAEHWGTQTVDHDVPMIKDEDDEELCGDMSSAGRIVASINEVINKLSPVAARKATTWKESLRAVATEVTRPAKTIIAVVGATGARKSSLINALLGDHVVPTDGMQSCTSTPIEISYHEQELVNATIEFITTESWVKEISHLLSALQDPDVNGSTAKLQAVDDGQQAWDRVRVVYPTLREDSLAYYSTERILRSDPEIAAMLGNTVVFSSTAENFKTELQEFFATRNGQVDLWPLVARVRIQCDAAVLQDNTTLVDLPGVGDSNTARSAIYHNYLRTADHIFVVAQIKRAATDQVARDLLGEAFRARLMNEKYSPTKVTFVATCNDDIACSEIVSALRLKTNDDWRRLETKVTSTQETCKRLKASINDLERRSQGPDALRLADPLAIKRKIVQKRRELDQLSSLNLDAARQLFCAEKRTEWVTLQIQSQFRAGIAALRDESPNEHGDDEGDISVFCVSSNDFMKLVGKSPYDGRAAVFQTTDQTCIPALVQYARGIGVAGIRAANQQKAARLSALLQEIQVWTTTSQSGSRDDRARLKRTWKMLSLSQDGHYVDYTERLAQVIRKAASEAGAKFLRDVDTLLIPKMTAAATKAENAASERLSKLGQNIPSWPTLKAIFRRAGCWKHHDWNAVAVELMSRHFAATWQKTLKAKSMQDDARLVGRAVDQALAHVEQAAADSLKVLVSEHKALAVKYVHTTTQLAIQECLDSIRDEQQDISRGMAARVAAKLETLYKRCWSQSARGAKARSLLLLREGIEEVKYDLFTFVIEDTSTALRAMLEQQLDSHYAKLARMATSIERRMSPIWDDTKPNAALLQSRAFARDLLIDIEFAIEELGYEA